jgi:hypothetical protein
MICHARLFRRRGDSPDPRTKECHHEVNSLVPGFPDIPEPLSFLETLSRNLWWSWNQNAIELFRRINPRLWDASGRNPIVFATHIPQERFEELAHDDSYLAHWSRCVNAMKTGY